MRSRRGLFAWRRMGAAFTGKTFAAVALVLLFAHPLPRGIAFACVAPVLSAVLGGLLCGVGMLMLFRHHASLGGVNVLVLYLQGTRGCPASSPRPGRA